MRFIIPPMTLESAVTAVLNTCMHTMHNKLPWDDARQLLTQLMQDAFEMGKNQGRAEATPAVEQVVSTEPEEVKQIGESIDKLA